MRLDPDVCRRLAASAPSARLATLSSDGSPHLVPIVLAVSGDVIVTAVDAKPKTTRRLQRLRNLEGDPRCAVLVDHYEEDWDRLWWARADGRGILDASPEGIAQARALLSPRYPQYHHDPPQGPVIRITVQRWTGWASTPEALAS